GALLDFDYTGKLGLLALQPDGKGPRYFRNFSSEFALYFSEMNVTSGLPATLSGAGQLVLEDLNGDELLDVIVARTADVPLVFTRQRGGPLGETNLGAAWPAASSITTGDLNNDSLPDVIATGREKIEIFFGGIVPRATVPLGGFAASGVTLVDFDNDGWLDLLAFGNGLRVWRNMGASGFSDVTTALGLDKVQGNVQFAAAADFDGDCDTDLALAIEGVGLQVLRNDGGNAHRQLKVRLVGKRSNASGLGVRLELSAGGLRSWRTVQRLPLELGVAKHTVVDAISVRWSDGFINYDELPTDKCVPVSLDEVHRELGSCPYLYAWDGTRFRYVTDLLGAAPLGLPLNDTRFIDADAAEFVWLRDEAAFPPRGDRHVVQVTEELREVLYLDEAKLVVVDHPP